MGQVVAFLNLTSLPRNYFMLCLPSGWLMLTSMRPTHWRCLVKHFPLIWSEIIILNQLLNMLLVMALPSDVRDSFFFSCENMFCSFIDLLFFRRSDIADNSGRTLLLCMYSFFTKSKNRIGYVICTVLASQLPSIYHPSNVAYFFLCCITSWSKWLLIEIRTLEEWIFFDKFQYVTGKKCIYIYI